MYSMEGNIYRNMNDLLRNSSYNNLTDKINYIFYILLLIFSIGNLSREKTNIRAQKLKLYRGICIPDKPIF